MKYLDHINLILSRLLKDYNKDRWSESNKMLVIQLDFFGQKLEEKILWFWVVFQFYVQRFLQYSHPFTQRKCSSKWKTKVFLLNLQQISMVIPDGNKKTFSNYFEGQNMDNYPLLQSKSSPIIAKGKIRMMVPKDDKAKIIFNCLEGRDKHDNPRWWQAKLISNFLEGQDKDEHPQLCKQNNLQLSKSALKLW